jgi:putative DNA primase/helicase
MKHTIRSIYREVRCIDDPRERAEVSEFVLRSENHARLRGALAVAESELPLVLPSGELDARPMLFNAANGTIDLTTGVLREHRSEDHLTRVSPVCYRAGASAPVWDTFLNRITGADRSLAGFLQRAVGYSLTGSTSEEKLFFAHGPAASGKSTFLEAIRAVMGEYAVSADFDTFLRRTGGGGVRNDLARLAGARFVTGVEVDRGREFAAATVKQLTGGDTISARYLYREFFDFQPQFKLWLAGNDRPRVDADDEGMWRRILQLPFTHSIPPKERDPHLKQQLRYDPDVQAAILTWAVEGCLAWQQHGLEVPDIVSGYTQEYRQENDPVADFLADACELGDHLQASRAAVRAAYQRWAVTNGERQLEPRQLATALKRHGIIEGSKLKGERAWSGLSIRSQWTQVAF